MGSKESLLQQCFWRTSEFQEYGFYVIRFFKDCNIVYVIIDDKIPVHKQYCSPNFARCRERNELWVPLMEKAYAKIHGCYSAIIGGYTHCAVIDMTGYCRRDLVFVSGLAGYSRDYSQDELWELVQRYCRWGCLMGTGIQPDASKSQAVESDVGQGLRVSHAYSLLDVGEIKAPNDKKYADKNGMVRLVKLRNPWGDGEWEGPYGDETAERIDNAEEIKNVFLRQNTHEDIVVDFHDGTFFMPFKVWRERFSTLNVAVRFPDGTDPRAVATTTSSTPERWVGKRTQGKWSGEVGGNRYMTSWISNPKLNFRLGTAADVSKNLYKRSVVVVPRVVVVVSCLCCCG